MDPRGLERIGFVQKDIEYERCAEIGGAFWTDDENSHEIHPIFVRSDQDIV